MKVRVCDLLYFERPAPLLKLVMTELMLVLMLVLVRLCLSLLLLLSLTVGLMWKLEMASVKRGRGVQCFDGKGRGKRYEGRVRCPMF